jgi:cysteine desulfurase family protein
MDLPKHTNEVIYLDNASTVFPKPSEVLDEMVDIYRHYGVNPGRAGYDLCKVGGELVESTRAELTHFFGADDPERLVFAYNASDALNILIQGMVEPGDHVVATVGEHNSVIRPLNHLREDKGIQWDPIPYEDNGRLDPQRVAESFRPETKLVCISHGSNVIGTIQPISEIGRLCRERGIRLLIDTAQTAGVIPINMKEMGVDALAFTGHKSMLGPTGIGGLCVTGDVTVKPTRYGGTGIKSADPFQLEEYPFRLEVGTGNILGIVGLHLAQAYIAKRGMSAIYQHEMTLFGRLQTALMETEGVTLYGTTSLENRLPVLSFTFDSCDTAEAGTLLDEDHNVAVRAGLHCAPLMHKHLGTAPRGTVRMSVGPMNQDGDIDAAIGAVEQVASAVRK